jgi:hypothetical protein
MQAPPSMYLLAAEGCSIPRIDIFSSQQHKLTSRRPNTFIDRRQCARGKHTKYPEYATGSHHFILFTHLWVTHKPRKRGPRGYVQNTAPPTPRSVEVTMLDTLGDTLMT